MHDEKVIEVLAHIENEREAFRLAKEDGKVPTAIGLNMADWFIDTGCGTTACFAGHTVLMEGYETGNLDWSGREYLTINGRVTHVADVAAEILGLTVDQQQVLFYCGAHNLYYLLAEEMGVDEQVLRDKVQAAR